MVRRILGDDLAQAMENVLNDEEYQKIFTPQKKLASKEPAKVRSLDNVQDAFDALIEVSAELDELGLTKSALQTLEAAHSIIAEAHDEEDVPAESLEKDEELENLLKEFGDDSNEVMDKPDDHDESEGNPESC